MQGDKVSPLPKFYGDIAPLPYLFKARRYRMRY
jgi:hypothetical protein